MGKLLQLYSFGFPVSSSCTSLLYIIRPGRELGLYFSTFYRSPISAKDASFNRSCCCNRHSDCWRALHFDYDVEAPSTPAKRPANTSYVPTSLHLYNKIADYAFKFISQRRDRTSYLTSSLSMEHMASADTQILLFKLGFWLSITWRPHLEMSCKASVPLYAALCSFETILYTDGKARAH